MQADFDRELQAYFTDVDHLRNLFKQCLAAPTLPKRLLVIHGVGGVGKSSLLRMFRLDCKNARVPVALISGDEVKSSVDVLSNWAKDLKADNVTLPTFSKTFDRYRAVLAKIATWGSETKRGGKSAELAGKVLSEAAEEAGGAIIGAAIGSIVPGIGTLAGALAGALVEIGMGVGAEALKDWLRGQGFAQSEIDLVFEPERRLTDDLLADLTRIAARRRIVIMLDTYERLTAQENWVCDFAQRLHSNVLMVMAGRGLPNWEPIWHGWIANAYVEQLEPMNEENMRELVRRCYASWCGGEPDPKNVEAVISFARGLPMVVTSAVRLWVKYGVEDFQAVKPEIVADLVDRLMKGVPKELVPALEAAATVRWFDRPILRAMMQRDDVRDVYNELRRFPFVRTRVEGLALHDTVREIIDENLRVHDGERYRELHERAAAYFEAQLEKARGEDVEHLGLERLYHYIRVDEEAGMQLLRKIADALFSYSSISKLKVLLSDANNYPLERENSKLWREYYNARLLAAQFRHLEAIPHFERVAEHLEADSQLRLYALGELGMSLCTPELLNRPGHAQRASSVLYQAAIGLSKKDVNAIRYYWELIVLHRRLAHWDEVNRLYPEFPKMISCLDDDWRAYYTSNLKDLFGTIGNWREFLSVQKDLESSARNLSSPYLRVRSLTHWIFSMLWMGRYREVELMCLDSLETCLKSRYEAMLPFLYRNLSFAVALQDRFQEAEVYRAKWSECEPDAPVMAHERRTAIAYGFWGPTDARAARFRDAHHKLIYSLWVKRRVKDETGMPEVLVGLGNLYEILNRTRQAEDYYSRCLRLKWVGRRYFECGALTGLVRVQHALGEYAAIPSLLAEAEQLAQQYEYNDHLASLRLTQGHITWEGKTPTWENGFDAALRYYQHALIYALRYNRFLLDEVLSGRPQGTPLRPIISECLKRGEEGRKMLIALRDWWQTGVNDIGAPRPDTISPIPEGIPLLEAERIARGREPGDGSPQRSVVEQIEAALTQEGNP